MSSSQGRDPGKRPRRQRKLAALLHADVVGYSRLMGEDEGRTHSRLVECRRVFDTHIGGGDGRIVNVAGDAVLAEFPSVVDAVSAAVRIQDVLAGTNASMPEDQRLEFRIGINVGDVLVDGDDLFGDGVNVAARIESIAPSGGIAISANAYDQVKAKLNLAFRDLGTHQVKNIAEPLHVYGVESGFGVLRIAPARRWPRRKMVLAALLALFLIGSASIYLIPFNSLLQNFSGLTGIRSGKPTIAVLPFKNQSTEPEQDYFSDGITEDVISDLGRFSNLLVLSWNAVAPYRDRDIELVVLSDDLDVQYIVDGSVRRSDDRLRVTVQLTDASSGRLLWSERYDTVLEDVFSMQDRVAQSVVSTLAVHVTNIEQQRALHEPTENADAYDLVLRGRDQLRALQRRASYKARDYFERALILDPRYADAVVGLGWTYIYDAWFGWNEPRRAVARAEATADRALQLDPFNASAQAMRAEAHLLQGERDLAIRVIDEAISRNPNNATSHAIRARILNARGNSEGALESMQTALRLDPNPAPWWELELAEINYFLHRYEEAIELADNIRSRDTEYVSVYALLAAAYGQLGYQDKAADALNQLIRLSPFFDPETAGSWYLDPDRRHHLIEGLEKTGYFEEKSNNQHNG